MGHNGMFYQPIKFVIDQIISFILLPRLDVIILNYPIDLRVQ